MSLTAEDTDTDTQPYVPSGEGMRRLQAALGTAHRESPVKTAGPLAAVSSPPLENNEHYRRIEPAFLIRDDDDEKEPLIRGILYPGLITTISSWVGIGKTTLALSLIIALIRGQKALGLLQTGGLMGPVVYLTEQGNFSFRRTYRRTLNAHEMDSADFLRHTAIYGLEQYSILDPAVRESFAEATRDAALIVVDTFDEWLSADPNKTENALTAFRVLREAADRGAAVLILDHQGKSNAHQDRKQSSVAGSSAKQRPGDMVYRFDLLPEV
jgi:RecA-family ATPase